MNRPLQRLRYHVNRAIERGDEPIVEQRGHVPATDEDRRIFARMMPVAMHGRYLAADREAANIMRMCALYVANDPAGEHRESRNLMRAEYQCGELLGEL